MSGQAACARCGAVSPLLKSKRDGYRWIKRHYAKQHPGLTPPAPDSPALTAIPPGMKIASAMPVLQGGLLLRVVRQAPGETAGDA